MTRRDALGLVGFLLACLAVSAIGGAVTTTSVGTWYQGLQKPPFNPPDWVFAPVWTTLYVLMAIAGWRIWRRLPVAGGAAALAAFAAQLALNLAWSVLFFGFRSIGGGLLEVFFLFGAIVVTARLFFAIERPAGLFMIPYAAWVAFAVVLNASLWWLN